MFDNFSNQCDMYKVAKRFMENGQSLQPVGHIAVYSILLLKLYYFTSNRPAPFPI